MIKLLIYVCLSVAALAPGFAQTLTQSERNFALSDLYATRKQFVDALERLTDAQWTFKPDANTWSVAECAEHIALSEDQLFELIMQKILKSPADPSKKAEATGKDEEVLNKVRDRSHKAKAPETLVPSHRWATRQALIDHFRQSRDRTLDFMRTSQEDLRSHFSPHPIGTLDAYQWVLLVSAHTQRHVEQMNEVKSNPKFPKN